MARKPLFLVRSHRTDKKSETGFESVVRRACRGDDDAVAALWNAHQPALLGWLRALAPASAEDVSSETWISALRTLDNFEGDENAFRTWLFTIGRRRLIDEQRRDIRRPVETRAVLPDLIDDEDASDPVMRAAESEASAAFVAAVLPPNQAEVVLLRVIAGLDTDQVATVLEKTPEAVRVLQHRGLKKLATRLFPRIDSELHEDA